MYAQHTKDRPATRKPQRLTITVSFQLYARLERRAVDEGRSLSNLCAYLLERSFETPEAFK